MLPKGTGEESEVMRHTIRIELAEFIFRLARFQVSSFQESKDEIFAALR